MKHSSIIWDKTNIGENYPGTTTPLTYSFIRMAYANVYPEFLHMIGVEKETLDENVLIFNDLIGYVDGQVFYNISNWYEMLKLLPGYRYNKEFFEVMLNPTETHKEKHKQPISFKFLWGNRKIIYRFSIALLFIGPYYRKFDEEFSRHLANYNAADPRSLDVVAFTDFFRKLQQKFFTTWRYTILNDFRVMIYYGLFSKIVKRYLPSHENAILTSLYGVHSKPESVVLLKALIAIAYEITSDQSLQKLFRNESSQTILSKLKSKKYRHINSNIQSYIDKFGTRSFNELKLEEEDFIHNNELFIDLLRQYSHYVPKDLKKLQRQFARGGNSNLSSYTKNLPWHIRPIYSYITNETLRSIHKREEYRLKRSKVFGIAKTMIRHLSEYLLTIKEIDDKDQVYYFYLEELFDYLRFHRDKEDWKSVLNKRKKQLKDHARFLHPRRITTTGTPSITIGKVLKSTKKTNRTLSGTVTAKGTVLRTAAVVMRNLDFNQRVNGKLLVTEATDPGWTVLFPLIKGIIIEKGGMLSHASIVAREIGIPCMIIPEATNLIQTGDVVSLDTNLKNVYVEKK